MTKSDPRADTGRVLFSPRAGEALSNRASYRARLLAAARDGIPVSAEIYSSAFPDAVCDRERIALCELLSYADTLQTDEAAAINIIGMTPGTDDGGTLREALITRFGLSECTLHDKDRR